MSPSTPARPNLPVQPNPFGNTAIGSPWNQVPADVGSINDVAFRAVLAELAQLRMGGSAASIVITGEPGSGKTHLLGRLRNRIAQDEREGVGETAFVYVRCNASAATLWRHLRRALAADLLKQEGGQPSRLQKVLRTHPERIDELSSFSLQRVLRAYSEGRHIHAASGWLRGEPLPDSDLATLGIAAEKDDEDRSRETEAKEAVNGLLSFVAPDPVVLCFDQVEALQTYRGDDAGFHTMGALVSLLKDAHSNLLLVTCLLSTFEDLFDRLPNQADRARWRQRQVTLQPIDWDHGVELIRGRLDGSAALAELRRAHAGNPLWPLEADALKPFFQRNGLCLPRTLIQASRSQFESLFGQETEPRPKLSREDFLQQEFERNLKEARVSVPLEGADKILGESLPWLLQQSGYSPLPENSEHSRYANLAFRGEGGEFAVVFCSFGGVKLTNRLRKIQENWRSTTAGVRVIRDSSTKPGAKGEALLNTIRSRGGQEIHPLPEALAALQAIHNMITSARSGDLTQNGAGVSEGEVSDWAMRNLPPQLEKLREDLMGRQPPDPMLPRLAALVNERKVVSAEAAARELSISTEEVSACARRHSMRFGLLAGPPLVLFQAVEGSQPENPDA
jgi:hypothetical protein